MNDDIQLWEMTQSVEDDIAHYETRLYVIQLLKKLLDGYKQTSTNTTHAK